MNDTLQTNPSDDILRQAMMAKAKALNPAAPDTTSHLFGTSPSSQGESDDAPDLSWISGEPAPKVKEQELDEQGKPIVPANTTPDNTPPAKPSVPKPSLNLESIKQSLQSHIEGLFNPEAFATRYKKLGEDNKLAFSAPDFSKIEIPSDYVDDPVVASRMVEIQRTATFDAVSQMVAILPDILSSILGEYSSITNTETNNLSLKANILSDYNSDPVHAAFAEDALKRFISANPEASEEEAKKAVKDAFTALSPKKANKPAPTIQNWG